MGHFSTSAARRSLLLPVAALSASGLLLAGCGAPPEESAGSSAASGSASASSCGPGYVANSVGVTEFTRTSVVCAESTVATRSCRGLVKSSSATAYG